MIRIILVIASLSSLLFCSPVFAQDMRQASVEAEKIKAAMVEKAAMEKETALQEARKARARIFSDNAALEAAVA